MSKLIFGILCVLFVSASGYLVTAFTVGGYQYEKLYLYHWNLAEKAATLQQKSIYIDSFVMALDKGDFHGKYNALFLETPDNSFDKNLEALMSLQLRLKEIQKMDVNSFQYQSAMEQITKQEQGEASAMVDAFKGIWFKEHWLFAWEWIGASLLIITIFLFCAVLIVGVIVLES